MAVRRSARKRAKVGRPNVHLFDLPRDVITNILTKLPFETILDCKLICKELHDIIIMTSDSQFAEAFYNTSRLITLLSYHVSDGVPQLRLIEGYQTRQQKYKQGCVTMTPPYFGQRADMKIANSCYGFILMTFSFCTDFLLYNPLTNESMNLPDISIGIYRDHKNKWDGSKLCGLGFCQRTCQLKVMRTFFGKIEGQELCRVGIITVGDTRWRKVDVNGFTSDSFDPDHEEPIALNGMLYWQGSENSIICFNVEREELSLIKPVFFYKILCIGVMHGQLCVSDIVGPKSGTMQLWLMEEKGGEKCWTESALINLSSSFGHNKMILGQVKGRGDQEEIVMSVGCRSGSTQLVYYNYSTEYSSRRAIIRDSSTTRRRAILPKNRSRGDSSTTGRRAILPKNRSRRAISRGDSSTTMRLLPYFPSFFTLEKFMHAGC